MSDRDEILNLLNIYSHTVDGGDMEGFAALFEYAEWSIDGAPPSRGIVALGVAGGRAGYADDLFRVGAAVSGYHCWW